MPTPTVTLALADTPLPSPTATPLPAIPPTPTESPVAEPTSTVEIIPTEAVSPPVLLTPTVSIKDTPGPPRPPDEIEALAQQGVQVYLQQYCGVCHTLEAARTAGLFGPDQNHLGTVAEQRLQDANYIGLATTASEYIRESILNPGIYLVEGYGQSRHPMPSFTHLNETEVEALVQMLLQQK